MRPREPTAVGTSGGNEYCSRTRCTEKERGGEKERQTSALESMRMSEGEGECKRERERGRKEKELRGGRANEEGSMSTYHWKERGLEVQENRLLPEGAEGSPRGQDSRRMRGGRGNARSRSDSVSPLSLLLHLAQPFSVLPHSFFVQPSLSSFLVTRAHARKEAPLLGPNRSSPSLSRRLAEDPRPRPTAHDPRPRGHGVIPSGVLNIWVIVHANRRGIRIREILSSVNLIVVEILITDEGNLQK